KANRITRAFLKLRAMQKQLVVPESSAAELLEVSSRISEMLTYLAAVAREYKLRNLEDSTKGSLLRDSLPVRVVRQYMKCLPPEVHMEIWARNLALDFEVQNRSTGEGQVYSDRKNRTGEKLSVVAISAIVKHFARNAELQGRYTAYNLRIGVQQ
ncbi:8885_t:CDS:2, partial [Scutellospora calospora]